MGWFLGAALLLLAILTPRFGADIRDSRDWAPTSDFRDAKRD
ncbi:MAG: hypothetical protein JWM93_3688 [Frankiales bacterium]|nr:hypothetical protein [Frankiales bacterium]